MRPRRLLLVAATLLLVAGVVTAAVLLLRKDAPSDVAERYLRASWDRGWRTECELATDQWRDYLYGGVPYADCTAFAKASRTTAKESPFEPFRKDTTIDIAVQPFSEGDGKARVTYVVELRYHGDYRSAFDAVWQGAGARDRGTIELVETDGGWRIAGVDEG